jgi:hypothetical protein
MRAMFASLLLRKCLHSGTLADAQGTVQSGCCQTEGRQGKIVIILFLFVIMTSRQIKKFRNSTHTLYLVKELRAYIIEANSKCLINLGICDIVEMKQQVHAQECQAVIALIKSNS